MMTLNRMYILVTQLRSSQLIPTSRLVAYFRVADFLLHFTKLLQESPHTSWSALAPQSYTRIDAFKCFTVWIPLAPQITKLVTDDVTCYLIDMHLHSYY
jgi:hypothetical protein